MKTVIRYVQTAKSFIIYTAERYAETSTAEQKNCINVKIVPDVRTKNSVATVKATE